MLSEGKKARTKKGNRYYEKIKRINAGTEFTNGYQ